ncbi:MAG: CRISPR system precrRNA processing endoribonuclease RAMP protein Cas6 [Gammaproteobacteria bacterium]
MMRLRFELKAIGAIELPTDKGSAFHGGFGRALGKISPIWYDYFFRPASCDGNALPKPFALLPPADIQQFYRPGETFVCECVLFGEAVRHAEIARIAVDYLGREMGLGYGRGKFEIIETTASTFSATDLDPKSVTLSLLTRLRLKAGNRLLNQSPEFSLLAARLFGRLKTLQQSYGASTPDEQLYRHLLQRAREIKQTRADVYWKDWDRYSGNQKDWMKFGGLLGRIGYQGHLKPFIHTLQMGEWTHVGGKSSFGLGKYSIYYGDTE